MRYKFTYRRRWFWQTIEAVGHKYVENQNKMIVYLTNGGLQEIKDWKNCEIRLGADWYAETKKEMEKAAGQPIATDPK